jgi:hypothetical protein
VWFGMHMCLAGGGIGNDGADAKCFIRVGDCVHVDSDGE